MVRIDMSTVAAREKAFGEYGDTVWFIYRVFSERLKRRMKEQGVSKYQTAGFKNAKEYNEAPSYQHEVSYSMVDSMTAPIPRLDTRQNPYLVPSSKYYLRFVDTLNFKDVYECIWGSNYEIRNYLPNVFESVCNEAQFQNNRLGSLINDIKQTQPLRIPNNTIQQIYEGIKSDLLNEWDKFTRVRNQETKIATVIDFESSADNESIAAGIPLIDKIDSGGVSREGLGEVLELKQLGEPLKRFVDYRVTPLIMNRFLQQISK